MRQYSIAKDPMGNKLMSLYKGVEKKRRKAAMLIFTWEKKERGIKKDQQPLVSCSFLLFFWEDNVNLFSYKGVFRSCVDGRP